MKHLSHFSRSLKLAVLFGTGGALVGCHGGPDELSLTPTPLSGVITGNVQPTRPDGNGGPQPQEQALANSIADFINTQQQASGGTLTDEQMRGLAMTVMAAAEAIEDYVVNNRGEIATTAIRVGNSEAQKGSVTQSSGTYAVNGTLNTPHQIEVDFDSLVLGRRSLEDIFIHNGSGYPNREIREIDINNEGDRAEEQVDFGVWDTDLGDSFFAPHYFHESQARNSIVGLRAEAWNYVPGEVENGEFVKFPRLNYGFFNIFSNIGDPEEVIDTQTFRYGESDTLDVFISAYDSDNYRSGRGIYNGASGTWHCRWPCVLGYEDGGARLSDRIETTEGFVFRADAGTSNVNIRVRDTFRIMEEDVSIYADRNGKRTEITGKLTCSSVDICRWGPAVGDNARAFYSTGSSTRTFSFAGGPVVFTSDEGPILEYTDSRYVVGGLWTNILVEYGARGSDGHLSEDVDYQFGAFVDGPVDGALVFHPASGNAKFSGSAGVNFLIEEANVPVFAWADAEFDVNWNRAEVGGRIFNFHRYVPGLDIVSFRPLNREELNQAIGRISGTPGSLSNVVLTLEAELYSRDRNSERFGFLYGHGEVHGGGGFEGWRGGYGAEFFGENAESLAGTFGASKGQDSLYGFFITERCEHGARNQDGSCPEVCEHGARLSDNTCPCEHGARLDDESCPPAPVAAVPLGGFAGNTALTGYIGENAAAVSTAFTAASSVTVKIGSITQSSRTDGGETADQVGIANFYSIAAEANGADGISISALQIGNAGTGASWTEISGAGFNFDMQSTLEAGMMTLAGIHGALAINGGGTLFMDVYTNIEAPVNTTPPFVVESLQRNIQHDAIFPEGANGFVRRGRAKMPHGSIEDRLIEGTWECVDVSSCAVSISDKEVGEPSGRITSVEGMTFTPDNGSVMVLSDGHELILDDEEINLLMEDASGRQVVVPGRLFDENSGPLSSLDSLWNFAANLPPRLGEGQTILEVQAGNQFEPDASITESPDTDYLVGGVWAVLPESGGAFEVGAFADGVARLQDLPTVGMATYTGAANGLAYEDGNLFNFKADAAFTADWVDNSVNGSLTNFNLAFENTSAEADFRGIVPENFQLDLNTPFFGSDEGDSTTYGIFTDGNTTSGSDNPGWTGSWGGQFFGDEGSSLAGTFGAADADGKAMVGNFLTEKETE